ncbi:hypothetical protein F5883DRAFT_562450 [Diaporthe sp. PMI_573]|nr:hypothetical protein F5883DRAFT_562450 [Diaporthaceae sp. PMI_573]
MTRPFPFPPPDLPTNKVNGFVLCRNAACEPCAVAPESVPVHSQCFKTLIAIRKTHDTQISLPQLLDYVWTRACYRRPWFRASDLGLASCNLLDIIKQYSPHAYLWRFASILALKPRPISWQLPQTLALQSIEGWQRGDQEVAGLSDGSPLIQITVDSQGVQAIKRLPHLPKVNSEGSKQYAYIVEDFSNLAGVQACIRDGLLRLRLPLNIEYLPVWDTPSPPRLTKSCFQPELQRCWQYFRTVSFESARGITFLYSLGYIHGVFAHTLTEPCALALYRRFPRRLRKHAVWVYFPISREDKIIGFGTKESDDGLSIMLSGDFTIGPQSPGGRLDRWLYSDGPITLAYSVPSDRQLFPVSLGAYSRSKSEETQYAQIPENDQYGLGNTTYFSSAPLDNISCAYILSCRVDVDRERKCFQPSVVCFRTIRKGRHPCGIHVDLVRSPSPRHLVVQHSQDEWQYLDLSDAHTLQFWFSEERSLLRVIPRSEPYPKLHHERR